MLRGIILAGGLGSRMREWGSKTPKALLDVGGSPLVAAQFERLRDAGVQEIIMATGHLGDQLVVALGDGSEFGVSLEYSHETKPMGTGGAVALAASREVEADDIVVVLNGDLISGHDLQTHFRAAAGSHWCIHVRHEDDARPYGVVEVDDRGRIKDFIEKPAEEYAALVNAGTYVTRGDVLLELDPQRACSLERDVFPEALAAGLDVRAYIEDAPFLDVGTPDAWREARYRSLRVREVNEATER